MSWTFAGKDLTRGAIEHTARCAWTADIEVADETAITGTQTLSFPGLDLVGTVVYGEPVALRQHLRLVAGRGGLSKLIPGQSFYRATMRTVVQYLLRAAGEQLATDSDAAILARELAHWTHVASSCGNALDLLCEHLGTLWWVDHAGNVHIGDHTWQTVEPEHGLIRTDPVARAYVVSTTDDMIEPGTVFLGQRMQSVEHTWDGVIVRTIGRWGTSGRAPNDDYTRMLTRHHQVRTLPPCEAVVETMNSDGTVDLKPTDGRYGPGWQHVEIAHIGGFVVKVKTGVRCKLEFLNGDPTKPIVTQFMGGGEVYTEMVMATGAEAARKGDSVDCGSLTVTATAMGTFVWTYTDGNGMVTTGILGAPIPIKGKITGGSTVVKKVA